MRLISSFTSSIQLLQHLIRLFVKMQISSRLITSDETKQSLGKSLWKCRTYYMHKSWTPWISPFQILLVSSHSDKEWSFCRSVNPSTEWNMVKFYASTCSFKALVYICRCNNSCSNVDKNHGSGPQTRSLKTWVEKSQRSSQKNWQNYLSTVSTYIFFCQSTGLIFFVCLNNLPLREGFVLEMLVCPKLRSRYCWEVNWDKHPKVVSGSSCKMSLFFIFSSIIVTNYDENSIYTMN